MRREGRQHGHVRTHYMAPDSQTLGAAPKKAYRRIEPPATAGPFHRVNPGKPSNHSKFTGKCERARCGLCHLEPVGKPSTKTKGRHKHRARDVLTNYRMYAWRLVDRQPPWALGSVAFGCFGESAASLISSLAQDCYYYYYYSSVPDDEELELSRDFQGKAEIAEASAPLEAGETGIESGGLFNGSSSASDCGSWPVEILSESEDEDWCLVDGSGRNED